MSEYSTYFNGKYTHVYDLDDCIRAIQCRNKNNEERIKYLEEENEKLKEEHYKDEQLYKLKQQLNRMEDDYYRGFPISEDEEKTINKWKKDHDEKVHGYNQKMRIKAEGCCGGRYTYIFIPTSLGISGRIMCNCGECFEFKKIE